MSITRHTAIAVGAAANAAILEAPLGQLDQAITDLFAVSMLAPTYRAIGTWDPVAGTGDATAAIVQAVTDTPVGGTLFFPAGNYRFSSVTVNKSIWLRGAGWIAKRDSVGGFGDVNYGTIANFGGTVLRTTAATGSAITCTVTETDMLHATDFLLIGPGSGSAIGITYGGTLHALTEGRFDVGVANLATGVSIVGVEDSDIHIFALGCSSGIVQSSSANQNTLRIDCQKCGAGYADDATCSSNTYINPLFQANTATSLVVNGNLPTFIGGYFENPGGVRALDIFGLHSTFVGMRFNDATDGIRINAGAKTTQFHNLIAANPATPFIDNGTGTQIVGDTLNFVFSGTPVSIRVINDLAASLYSSDGGATAPDTTAILWGWQAGADATLGPLQILVAGHPSATAANRYAALRALDSAAYRLLKLQDVAGDLGFGNAAGKIGFYGHAAVAQPVAPVTLADVIAIIRGNGLSA